MNLLQGSRGKVKLRIFGDYVRGKIDGGNGLECINLPRLGTGLDCVFNCFHANVELTNVFKQEDVGPLETETDGYNMLDTQLTYHVHEKDESRSEIFVKGTSLLDHDARQHSSFIKDRAPLVGRSGMIGLRARY
jgi:iron complex outermembrane receptor protein